MFTISSRPSNPDAPPQACRIPPNHPSMATGFGCIQGASTGQPECVVPQFHQLESGGPSQTTTGGHWISPTISHCDRSQQRGPCRWPIAVSWAAADDVSYKPSPWGRQAPAACTWRHRPQSHSHHRWGRTGDYEGPSSRCMYAYAR